MLQSIPASRLRAPIPTSFGKYYSTSFCLRLTPRSWLTKQAIGPNVPKSRRGPCRFFMRWRAAWTSTKAARSRLAKSEEHTSELQSLMRKPYAVFCLQKKNYYDHTQFLQYTILSMLIQLKHIYL